MRKVFVGFVGMVLAVSLVFTGCGPADGGGEADVGLEGESVGKPLKVGISQFMEHPALDAARDGFIDGLLELGYEEGPEVEFILKSAQGDSDTCRTIAAKFVQDGVDLLVAIATPNAQAAANVVKDIPIVITAITDPVAAGLAESMERPGGNITGTSDMNPVREQIALVKDFLPEAASLGIIYDAGEDNSLVQVEMAREVVGDFALELLEATVTNSSEVSQAAASLVGKVDAIYVPTDNAVASAISAVIKEAHGAKIPVFGSESAHVEQGGLATFGVDYYLLGKQTAGVADAIFKGQDPGEIPIQGSRDLQLVINKRTAAQLGLTVPADLLAAADEIID
ncbi:MAG: ABC transporter substrate-binding protein [Firmicutes bacterium]|nr:ABC transporter substrate-binding protein [Bacillota bacterium]